MKEIKGSENYFIDEIGNVYSNRKCRLLNNSTELRIIKSRVEKNGYLRIGIFMKSVRIHKSIHRLVAETFISNFENKPCVNHINGIKTDNRVENLEWCTISENIQHAYKNGLKIGRKGSDHHNVKLTEKDIISIRLDKRSQREIANYFNVSQSCISHIKLRKKWKHI